MTSTFFKAALLVATIFSATSTAHMHLADPKPLNFDRLGVDAYNWWVGRLGGQRPNFGFPCLGQLPSFGGAPVEREWQAGRKAEFTLGGEATHYGGSSQASISIDGGKTWRVMKSFSGTCPRRSPRDSQKFEFTVPAEVPQGEALFAWSWHNRENEMYHNCAKVMIRNSGRSTDLANLPLMLEANTGNGCVTPPNPGETLFVNPGPEFDRSDEREYKLLPPTGNCATAGASDAKPTGPKPEAPNNGENQQGTPAPKPEPVPAPVEEVPAPVEEVPAPVKEVPAPVEEEPATNSGEGKPRTPYHPHGCKRNWGNCVRSLLSKKHENKGTYHEYHPCRC